MLKDEPSIQKELENISTMESHYRFRKLDHEIILSLGNLLVAQALQRELPVTIEISIGPQCLFHVALPGTTVDNDEWIKGKTKVVHHFQESSLAVALRLKQKGRTLKDRYIESSEYRAAGGGVPIRTVESHWVQGVLVISGLTQEEDHAFAVEGLEMFFREMGW